MTISGPPIAPPTRWSQPLRRFRRAFARENLKDLFGTLGLVAFFSVLIWVWAEREQVVQEKQMPTF